MIYDPLVLENELLIEGFFQEIDDIDARQFDYYGFYCIKLKDDAILP
ncbi:hypothetical protein [Anoxynatronum buryatiense]|uniref:Uncharacterized protein n=1 Tax=Anoxynatronum buryatiense TaxID=489973 RepID=A0AA45WZ65_9CLOT|nr:hypothetical protein [Anoxynatronum buryatiense]SMP72439.1 hypothetical protein SAMN06296020_1293 [Anoxynatronum buryatiense]